MRKKIATLRGTLFLLSLLIFLGGCATEKCQQIGSVQETIEISEFQTMKFGDPVTEPNRISVTVNDSIVEFYCCRVSACQRLKGAWVISRQKENGNFLGFSAYGRWRNTTFDVVRISLRAPHKTARLKYSK